MKNTHFPQKLLDITDYMNGIAIRLTANRYDADDLVQETREKVLNNEEKYVDDINFKGWVSTIMKNIFKNNRKRLAMEMSVFNDNVEDCEILSECISHFETPESAYCLAEINEAFSKLKPIHRVILTKYHMGFKYNEIAEELNMPLGSVKSKIFLAREELKRILEDESL